MLINYADHMIGDMFDGKLWVLLIVPIIYPYCMFDRKILGFDYCAHQMLGDMFGRKS